MPEKKKVQEFNAAFQKLKDNEKAALVRALFVPVQAYKTLPSTTAVEGGVEDLESQVAWLREHQDLVRWQIISNALLNPPRFPDPDPGSPHLLDRERGDELYRLLREPYKPGNPGPALKPHRPIQKSSASTSPTDRLVGEPSIHQSNRTLSLPNIAPPSLQSTIISPSAFPISPPFMQLEPSPGSPDISSPQQFTSIANTTTQSRFSTTNEFNISNLAQQFPDIPAHHRQKWELAKYTFRQMKAYDEVAKKTLYRRERELISRKMIAEKPSAHTVGEVKRRASLSNAVLIPGTTHGSSNLTPSLGPSTPMGSMAPPHASSPQTSHAPPNPRLPKPLVPAAQPERPSLKGSPSFDTQQAPATGWSPSTTPGSGHPSTRLWNPFRDGRSSVSPATARAAPIAPMGPALSTPSTVPSSAKGPTTRASKKSPISRRKSSLRARAAGRRISTPHATPIASTRSVGQGRGRGVNSPTTPTANMSSRRGSGELNRRGSGQSERSDVSGTAALMAPPTSPPAPQGNIIDRSRDPRLQRR